MDELLGEVLAYLPQLREAGRDAEAHEILRALSDGCSPRDILDGLRWTLDELPPDAELGEALAEGRRRILHQLEAVWAEL